MTTAADRFARLSTPAKLLLILTAVLLPIGLGLGWFAYEGIRQANAALKVQSDERARVTARSIESFIARNALALRVAANGRIERGGEACDRVRRSLSIAPAVAQRFRLHTDEGAIICTVGEIGETGPLSLIAPGDIQLRVAPDQRSLVVRVGVMGGIATTVLPAAELQAATALTEADFDSLAIRDGRRSIVMISSTAPLGKSQRLSQTRWPIGNGRLAIDIQGRVPAVTTMDRLAILLPLLMWFVAALITWIVVERLLVQPLRRLQRAVGNYRPGDPELKLPSKLGPATEIQDLRDSFARAVNRVEQSEHEMADALDGQRRLVREVHHRVKNNLQVVASLLNIHGRTAENDAARAAYAAIGRRVGALAIVHRNHFAELEENRGISLRPLLSEIAAELRAGAPEAARGAMIEFEVEAMHTTQDVAISIAFLVTEVVEFAMFRCPDDPIELSLRRTGELSARLTMGSAVLVPDEEGDREKVQFERIIAGLARQLRSTLERKLGRYSVDFAVFPAR